MLTMDSCTRLKNCGKMVEEKGRKHITIPSTKLKGDLKLTEELLFGVLVSRPDCTISLKIL